MSIGQPSQPVLLSRLYEASYLAERGGFEPPVGFYTYGALAKRCFRPLSHLSVKQN